jgi:hypothetical protein
MAILPFLRAAAPALIARGRGGSIRNHPQVFSPLILGGSLRNVKRFAAIAAFAERANAKARIVSLAS